MATHPVAALVEELLAGPRPMRIVQAGHPVLRRPTQPYDGQLDDDVLRALVEAMRRTMLDAPGVGLAAPQVGIPLRLAVVEDTWPLDDEDARVRERRPVPFRVLVNPTYEPVGDERVAFWEGCLSVRGWQAVTPRHRAVHLRCHDEHGTAVDEVLTGWPARIVQHETDHLDGRLYLDVAHVRSLCAAEEAGRWASSRVDDAARELGFDLP